MWRKHAQGQLHSELHTWPPLLQELAPQATPALHATSTFQLCLSSCDEAGGVTMTGMAGCNHWLLQLSMLSLRKAFVQKKAKYVLLMRVKLSRSK